MLRRIAARVLVAAAVLLVAGCATSLPDFPRTESHAWNDPAESTLLAQATSAAAERGGRSGFALLDNGTDAFAARALAAMRAERTLDIQYYLVHDGLTTRVLMHLVLAAAERGVRVRILLDDAATRGNDFAVATLAAHPNIEVRLFNPMYAGRKTFIGSTVAMLTNLNRLHRRMHNKLWIADNAIAVSGGRNLGDEYFGAAADVNFADIDLLSLGPVVADLSRSFDAYWNSPNAVPVEAFVTTRPGARELRRLRNRVQAYVASPAVQKSPYLARLRARQDNDYLSLGDDALAWGDAEAVWDDPAKVNSPGIPPENQMLASSLRPHFEATQKELLLVSAYFVPGDNGIALLSGLAQRGVDVRVLTNSLAATDVSFVYGAYEDCRAPLLAAGVGLYEMKPVLREKSSPNRFSIRAASAASLHTKAMVFDDDTAFIGSYNLDPRSMFWNTEVGVVVHSAVLSQALRSLLANAFDPVNSFRLVLDKGEIRYRTQEEQGEVLIRRPHASPWKRFQAWLADEFGPDRMM